MKMIALLMNLFLMTNALADVGDMCPRRPDPGPFSCPAKVTRLAVEKYEAIGDGHGVCEVSSPMGGNWSLPCAEEEFTKEPGERNFYIHRLFAYRGSHSMDILGCWNRTCWPTHPLAGGKE
jgi:hypothetical protein